MPCSFVVLIAIGGNRNMARNRQLTVKEVEKIAKEQGMHLVAAGL
jgi:hypothetical protein